MFKLSKRHSMGLFIAFLMGLPIAIQAAAPIKLISCVILLEEEPISAESENGDLGQ
jgi:hypothetical protein